MTKYVPVSSDDEAANAAIACPRHEQLVILDGFGNVERTLTVQRWAPVVKQGFPLRVQIDALICMEKP